MSNTYIQLKVTLPMLDLAKNLTIGHIPTGD